MTGLGTVDSPYVISSVADWQAINNDLTAYYQLAADLDFTGEDAVIDGDGDDAFTGSLSGQGYTISNITITSAVKGALFWENQGTIENLNIDTISITDTRASFSIASCFTIDNTGTITDVVITGASVSSESTVGAFAEAQGFLYRNDGGTITRCSVTFTTIVAISADDYARSFGFCNDNYGTISECCVKGTSISATATGDKAFVAGFCEDNTAAGAATIDDCYARVGTLIAIDGGTEAYAAGFILDNSDLIDDCYAQNDTITAADSVHGFCRSNTGAITNCFWDEETSGVAASNGGTGKTTAEMKAKATFVDAGWDFIIIWGILADINDGYPFLWAFAEEAESPRSTVAIQDKITLESIRNIEMSARGRFRVNKEGDAVYRSRYARNV